MNIRITLKQPTIGLVTMVCVTAMQCPTDSTAQTEESSEQSPGQPCPVAAKPLPGDPPPAQTTTAAPQPINHRDQQIEALMQKTANQTLQQGLEAIKRGETLTEDQTKQLLAATLKDENGHDSFSFLLEEKIVQPNAHVPQKDASGSTYECPLLVAVAHCSQQKYEKLQLLLNKGANPRDKTFVYPDSGIHQVASLVDLAVRDADMQAIQLILEKSTTRLTIQELDQLINNTSNESEIEPLFKQHQLFQTVEPATGHTLLHHLAMCRNSLSFTDDIDSFKRKVAFVLKHGQGQINSSQLNKNHQTALEVAKKRKAEIEKDSSKTAHQHKILQCLQYLIEELEK